MEKNTDKRNKQNRSIVRLTYVVVVLFIAMILYGGYFLIVKREDTINNTYNARLDSFSDRIIRGKILSNDGTVLAQTITDENGEETRYYPYGSLFAHVVGYSSRGKTGIEALGNFYMLTSHVNIVEQILTELSGEKNIGDDLYTTLDLKLQQAASDALGDRRGAVVAMEPDTGKILAMVSKPGYDPNTINERWDDLNADTDSARLLNRATQGVYPPGSVFKIVTLLEYIRENPNTYQNFHYDCNGIYEQGDYTIQCYQQTAHGSEDLMSAFANSCNGAFAVIGQSLDKDKLAKTADEVLFNSDLPLSIAYSRSSYSMGDDADLWEVLQTSIGQGRTQMTPVHCAMITAAIANKGELIKPYLLDHTVQAGGQTVRKFSTSSYGKLMTEAEAEILKTYMRAVVTDGTASLLYTSTPYSSAGKTGSAEFDAGKDSHAWFTGFAPYEDPKIVVTVIVEEGGSGGRTAVPIARAVFDAYLSN